MNVAHKNHPADLAYREALAGFLLHADSSALERAARLGDDAFAAGLGLPELLAVHQRALRALHPQLRARRELPLAAANEFLGAALTPYEQSRRGQHDSLIAWRHINETLEKEIRRIAHALHDESGQLMVALHLQLAQLARDLPAAAARVQDCQQILHQAEQQLRHLSHELRPMVLDDLGWLAAIEFLAHALSQRTRVPIEVRSSVTQRLAPAVETALYRVVQEALANATHHARASHIRVEVDQDESHLYGSISDDGVGFESAAHASSGVHSMHERLGALGGTLRVLSTPGRGTEVRFRVPLDS
jgi:two-component system, NarL family, sensor histidine kinase UhpB